MTDWIEHNGGPQPVGDDVWVEVADPTEGTYLRTAIGADWGHALQYRILDQDLAHAARLEGIRLGLKAAEEAAHEYAYQCRAGGHFEVAIAFATHADDLRNLNPDTIAKEAQHD